MKNLLLALSIIFSYSSYAQIQFVERIKAADSLVIAGYSIEQTRDSGFIVGGGTAVLQGISNPYILKLNKNGDTLWSQGITGVDGNWFSVAEDSSGYIACGGIPSTNGFYDGVVEKMNSNGIPQWTYCYGASKNDYLSSIQPYNNGYITTGFSVDSSETLLRVYLLHLSDSGNVIWSRIINVSTYDEGFTVLRTSDNNIMVAGLGGGGILIMKLDSLGNIIWSKVYGTVNQDNFRSIAETPDGSYVIVGSDGDLSTNFDMLVFKIDSSGSLMWSNNYDFTFRDFGTSGISTRDGNLLIAGYIVYPSYDLDEILFKLDTGGNVMWSKVYGDTSEQTNFSVRETFDGGYILGGNYVINDEHGILLMRTNEMAEVGCDGRSITPAKINLPLTELNVNPIVSSGCSVHSFFHGFSHDGIVDSVCNTTFIPENDFPENKIEVFPNPATDHVTIDVKDLQGDLTIFNSNGNLICKKTAFSQSFEISSISPGFYYIVFQTKTQNYFGKLIISH